MYNRDALKQLIHERALMFGDFTLASGKKASYYLDGKQVTLDSVGAHLVAQGILELLRDDMPQSVGGMVIGADPITAAVITVAGASGLPMAGFMVRKEAKGRGTNRFIEGPVQPGMTAVIVEDVVTTGGTSITAIERCVEFGLTVRGVIAVVDREEGGREAFAERGYLLRSLFSIRDFGIEPPAK